MTGPVVPEAKEALDKFKMEAANEVGVDLKDGYNALFCLLAGALWYSQFFGLSIGKGFLTSSEALTTLSFCILMALNVVFSNVWGIILKEWKGCNSKTISVLVIGLIVLVFAAFAEPLLNKVFGN